MADQKLDSIFRRKLVINTDLLKGNYRSNGVFFDLTCCLNKS